MIVLFLTRSFFPNRGGVEEHIKNISFGLMKRGKNVSVITRKSDFALKDNEIYRGIKIRRFFQPEIKFVGLLLTWYWIVKNIGFIKRADVVHIHDVFVWYLPLKILLPRKKVYITFHGWEGTYPIPFLNIVQKRLASNLSKRSLSIGEYISLHYGIRKDALSYGATNIPNRLSLLKESFIYVGRLEEDTGLKTFLEMFKVNKINNIEFCGDGSLSNECKKYGTVQGFVDPQLSYAKAKYCFASGYLTILEALSNKCLVYVAYGNPLKRDYYEMAPFSKYIVIGKNSQELLKKFNFYEKNPEEAKKKINKGYNWVKHQTWEKLVDDYLKLWGVDEKNKKNN